MIDLRLLRENPDLFRQASQNKRIPADIDAVLQTDSRLRELRVEVEELRGERNRVSKSIGKLPPAEREAALEEAKVLRERLAASEPELKELEERLAALLLTVPNLPDPEVPVGASEEDNVELRRWGTPRELGFEPKDHVDLALSLDLADFQRGSKVSGSRFYYLKNEGALLEMALVRWAIEFLWGRGLTPMIVPELVRDEAMTGTGFFPLGREDAYAIEKDGLYLVGTSEVPLVSFHMDEILAKDELPKRYVGHSSCFRREAGAAGKDTRGFYRVHQFHKVEQVVICENDPDVMRAEHEALVANVEALLQALELPHRVARACTGELGMGQTLKTEIETWMPSRGAYSETHSCSTLGEFQARRLNLRYRDADDKLRFCGTLNNTALASPRILIPILETYQQEDGTVVVPEVLRPYLPGIDVIRPKR
ncbi:MAG: serine--tRNA ligase [Armatimonadota bacterium]